jgi:hypothetical protein
MSAGSGVSGRSQRAGLKDRASEPHVELEVCNAIVLT